MQKSPINIHRFIDGHRGYLWRKSQLNGAWKYRFFVLEQKKVKCYEDDTCTKIISEFIVFNDTELFDMPGTSDNHSNLLYFSATVDDVYFLSADQPVDKLNWLEAITDAKHNGFKLMDQPRLGIEPFYPSVDLVVSFNDNAIFASNDNKLAPLVIAQAPSIIMRFAHPNRIYSLIMIDLDSVRANLESRTEYLMWGVVNIEGADISTGLELASYESPSPEYGTGMHRYMFLLFDQTSDFTPDQFDVLDEIFQLREQFSHLDWMNQFHLAAPVGINGFYAGWEEYCDVLHEQMGYTPAVIYFSPKMEADAETLRTEQARIDLFRDLVLGDVFPPDQVVPSQIPALGTIAMTIEYDNEYEVDNGNVIPAALVKNEPAVGFYPHPTTYDAQGRPECNLYSLLLVDPDAPSRINHDMREHICWVVLNIADADVTQGAVALPYNHPAPAYASGLHRYIFCMYKQNREFTAQEIQASAKFFAIRKGILSHEWVRSQHSILQPVPVSVEAFLSEWDLSVDDAHAASGYMPPEQYRSPAQRSSVEIASSPRFGFSLMTSRSGESDVIGDRLRQIQEANERFNIQLTETSRSNHDIVSRSTENSPKGDHTEGFNLDLPIEAETEPIQPIPKKVANRNPVAYSGTSKTLAPKGGLDQPLPMNIGEESSTAAAAALLNSREPSNDMVQSSRATTVNSSTSVAERAEQHTDQTQKVSTSNQQRRQASDGRYTEETTESQSEQHNEEHTERSNFRSESHSTTTSPRHQAEVSTELTQSQESHRSASENQQSQTKQLLLEAQTRHEQELQQQEQARRAQKKEMKRQQQEALDRQAQELEQQLRLQQELQEREMQGRQQQRSERSSRHQNEQQQQGADSRDLLDQQQQQQQQRSNGSSRQSTRLQQDSREQRRDPDAAPRSKQDVSRVAEEHKDEASPPPKGREGRDKSKTKDFFSAPPDSEYSESEAGSVLSGVKSRSVEQKAGSNTPAPGVKNSLGHASADADDEAASPVQAKPPPAVKNTASRYKQLIEGLSTVKSTNQLCDLFQVTSSSIFAGEKMKKKMNNDFMFKDSYIWVIPRTRTLHWCKTKGDAGDSKYLLLDTVTGVDPTAPPKGEFKGIVKRVRVSGPNLLVTIESGEFLELKLSADGAPPALKRANDWAQVIKAFSHG